ncbi:MAG TPA: hypothetical protein VD788_09270 [Candidatus Polarisedimenticolaceae bacterium]|nr:hypothetical protein [Candidatus Polarisedimenticolaceae bacterium]
MRGLPSVARRLGIAASLLLAGIPAAGEPVTFVFKAEVTNVFDGLGALGGRVEPGTIVRGTYTFDSETPNTAEPVDEGELGLYHHDRPPARVRLFAGPFVFRSVPSVPVVDIHVANDFGFAGTDEYGFTSANNQARGLYPSAPVDRIDLAWRAQNFSGQPFTSAALPLTPPDLTILGGGLLTIYGECTLCAGPAAFFRIEGRLTSLRRAVHMVVDHDALRCDPNPAYEIAGFYDLVRGDLAALRANGGDFAAAIDECLADDAEGAAFPYALAPEPGQGFWFLSRRASDALGETYDSGGLGQLQDRDEPIAVSGVDCP